MNLRRPCSACSESDTKDSIQAGLRQHDIVSGRYTAVEQAIYVVKRFKTQNRLANGFGFWDKSKNCESERWFGDKREILRVPDEGSEQIVQLNALETNR